jgi:DUF4097 and DUF4098 domain-containing protein YvlB
LTIDKNKYNAILFLVENNRLVRRKSMYTQTIPITSEKQIEIIANRDLELRGWEKTEISISVLRESDVQIKPGEEKLSIEANSDIEIWVPEGLIIAVPKVKGDAEIADLSGSLTIGGIDGDLDLNRTGETRVDAVGGDVDAKRVASLEVTALGGDCSVERIAGAVKVTNVGGDLEAEELESLQLINIGGDCSVRSISGEFSVANVGGDLHGEDLSATISAVTVGGDLNLRIKSGGVKAMVGGDLRIRFDELSEESVSLRAGGDVSLHLPPQASAKMHITSGGGDIMMRVGGWNERVEMFVFDFSLGEGKTPVQITAGGDVMVSDGDMEARKNPNTFEFSGVKVDVDAISQTVQDAVEKASRQAEIASREVEQRIQAAMRRVEAKGRKHGIRVNFDSAPVTPPATPPVQPAAPVQPAPGRVSDDERKLILQMLQDQKITAAEAAHLLDALEGKNQ